MATLLLLALVLLLALAGWARAFELRQDIGKLKWRIERLEGEMGRENRKKAE